MDALFSGIDYSNIIRLSLVGGISFLLSSVSIPVILNVSHMKSLFASTSQRSAHVNNTPNLGGIAIFISVVMPTLLFGMATKVNSFLVASLLILFFIGVKDDILVIDPLKKLVAQVLATLLLVFYTDIRIDNLYGLFGFYEINSIVSYSFTVFTVLVVINAYNFIDGVDGLAAVLALLMLLFLGCWFFVVGDINTALISVSLFFGLLCFLRHNFSKENKIFMGDTGSLITGFVLAFLLIRFIQLNATLVSFRFENAPIVGFVLFLLPLFDLLRIFVSRISRGISPFSADKGHVHHFFLGMGMAHKQITLVLGLMQLFYILVLGYLVELMPINFSLILIVANFVLYYFVVNPTSLSTRGSRTRRWVWRGHKVLRTLQR